MEAIGFYIILPLIYLISFLPFRVLYLISDILYFLLYHIIGYRKKVILTNLKKSFPEKSESEINIISKKFYHHLCDLIIETLKGVSISKDQMLRRCTMDKESQEIMLNFFASKQSCILVLGHLGNWEWGGNTFSLLCKQQLYVLYHPLKNKYFNDFIIKTRTRFGTKLIAMKDTLREMLSNRKNITATAFIADQAPPPESAHWTNFLNQDTPVFWGTEKIARKLNYPVIFIDIIKAKRGHYLLKADMLCEQPALTSEGELTELHTKRLEQAIQLQPEIWLWSHKRWKHSRKTHNTF